MESLSKDPKRAKKESSFGDNSSRNPSKASQSNLAKKKYTHSQNMICQAEKKLPHSDNVPFYVKRAKSAYLYDWDKNKYVDFELCHGTLLAGHAHPKVTHSIKNWVSRGYSQSLPTHLSLRLSEWIHKLYPKNSLEALRFFSSKRNAFRFLQEIVRKKKGKTKIFKILHVRPSFLELRKHGNQEKNLQASIQTELHNNLQNLEQKIRLSKNSEHEIGGICVDPLVSFSDRSIFSFSLGEELEREAIKNFLHRIKNLCLKWELFFILNEETLGFHLALGGAVEYFAVLPDFLFLGSAIGGAFPLYAVAGKREEFMSVSLDELNESDEPEQNLLAFVAGVQSLKLLKQQNPYSRWSDSFSFLRTELKMELENPEKSGFFLWNLGSCFGIAVIPKSSLHISSWDWMGLCLEEGVYLGRFPNSFCFLSLAHGQREVEKLLIFLRKLKTL